MKNKLAVLVVGLIIGVILGLMLPAGAHHNDRSLKRRLNRVENQVATLRNQMNVMAGRTSQMTNQGDYFGIIFGEQVISFCPAGSTAIWEEIDPTIEVTWLDDCFVGQQQEKTRVLDELRH